MFDQKKRTKDVLDRLKSQEATPKPKKEMFSQSNKSIDQNKIVKEPEVSQSIYQAKLEKSVNKLNDLEKKMKKGDNYFTYYYEYTKACSEFNDILKNFERFDTAFVPSQFKKRVDETKSKVTAHLSRKMPESRLNQRKIDDSAPKSADDLIDL